MNMVYVCNAALQNHVVVEAPGHNIVHDPILPDLAILAPLIGLSTLLAAR